RTTAAREEWYNCALSQIDYALYDLENPLGLLVTGKNSFSLPIGRSAEKRFLQADFHARHVYNLYTAYKVRGDNELYYRALLCDEMMYRYIPLGLAQESPPQSPEGLVVGMGRWNDDTTGWKPYAAETLTLFTDDYTGYPDANASNSPKKEFRIDGNVCA